MNQIEPGIVLTECLNPAKRHLFELPTYQGVKSPPVYDEYDICYFIPIFQTRPYDMTIEHHAVRSALWALNSFIANTDHDGVMFRLYCEEQVKARICAKLEQEGVNPDDWVVWFDGEPFEGDPQTHLGKTLAYMVDARFRSFVWAVKGDTDLFATECTNIFSHIRNECSYDYLSLDWGIVYNNSKLLGKHWLDWLQAHSTREQLLELWIKKASKIAGLQIIKKMYNNAGGASGMIHLFPVHTFWGDKNNERRLLAELSTEMQDDEAVVSIYSAMGYEVHKIAFPASAKLVTDLGPGFLFHPGDPDKVPNKELWYEMCKIGGAKTTE